LSIAYEADALWAQNDALVRRLIRAYRIGSTSLALEIVAMTLLAATIA
jgi:hypothetical protein